MQSKRPPREERVSTEIVENVAEATGADPLDLDPLYEAVDPDALNALFEDGFAGTVRFRYAGCSVAVHGGTDLQVTVKRSPSGSRSATTGTGEGV